MWDVAPSARTITLTEPVDGFDVIALTEESNVVSGDGEEIMLRDISTGTRIRASGRSSASGVLIAERVLVLAD
jgi:hypothetical protein